MDMALSMCLWKVFSMQGCRGRNGSEEVVRTAGKEGEMCGGCEQ